MATCHGKYDFPIRRFCAVSGRSPAAPSRSAPPRRPSAASGARAAPPAPVRYGAPLAALAVHIGTSTRKRASGPAFPSVAHAPRASDERAPETTAKGSNQKDLLKRSQSGGTATPAITAPAPDAAGRRGPGGRRRAARIPGQALDPAAAGGRTSPRSGGPPPGPEPAPRRGRERGRVLCRRPA